MPYSLWHWERICCFQFSWIQKVQKLHVYLRSFLSIQKENGRLKNPWFQMSSFASYVFEKKQIQFRSIRKLLNYFTKSKTDKAFSHIGCSKITILTDLWLKSLDSCAILISFKIVVIFNTTSADIKTKSADAILKMTTILKEMRMVQLNKWTDFRKYFINSVLKK